MGTGVAEIKKVNPAEFSKLDWLSRAGDLAIDNDVFAADRMLEHGFKNYTMA